MNYADLITPAVVLLTAAVTYGAQKARLARIEEDVKSLTEKYDRRDEIISEIASDVAVLKSEMKTFEREITEIKNRKSA